MSLNVYIKAVQRYFKAAQRYSKLSDSRTHEKLKRLIKNKRKKRLAVKRKAISDRQ